MDKPASHARYSTQAVYTGRLYSLSVYSYHHAVAWQSNLFPEAADLAARNCLQLELFIHIICDCHHDASQQHERHYSNFRSDVIVASSAWRQGHFRELEGHRHAVSHDDRERVRFQHVAIRWEFKFFCRRGAVSAAKEWRVYTPCPAGNHFSRHSVYSWWVFLGTLSIAGEFLFLTFFLFVSNLFLVTYQYTQEILSLSLNPPPPPPPPPPPISPFACFKPLMLSSLSFSLNFQVENQFIALPLLPPPPSPSRLLPPTLPLHPDNVPNAYIYFGRGFCLRDLFWWWQCSDRYINSLFPPPPYPLPPPPFSPSLISLVVSVDVMHHR